MELQAKVYKVATNGDQTEITFELPDYSKTLGLRNRKVTIPYSENPGWSKGETVTITVEPDN